MKLLTPIFLLLLLFCHSCSSPDGPKQLAKKVITNHYPKGKIVEDAGDSFRVEFDSADFTLKGNYKSIDAYLVVTLNLQGESEGSYKTGIFKREENIWVSLFERELIDGKLDTIMNLNDDSVAEFIIDEQISNTAGFDSYQFLYAKLNSSYWEKIDTLSRRMQGLMAGDYIKSTLSVDRTDGTLLIVESETSESLGENANVTSRVIFQWDPPRLSIRANEADEQSSDGETENLDASKATSGLPMAFKSKDQKLVNSLIEAGADKNIALFWAVEFEDTVIVRSLITKGARITSEATIEEWRRLVNSGMMPELDGRWTQIGKCSKVAFSANKALQEMVVGAIDGKMYSMIWEDEFTPGMADSDLIRASTKGEFAAVEFMLKAGADPNQRLGSSSAPCAAKQAGNQQIIDLLIKYGAKNCED